MTTTFVTAFSWQWQIIVVDCCSGIDVVVGCRSLIVLFFLCSRRCLCPAIQWVERRLQKEKRTGSLFLSIVTACLFSFRSF
jgi:hypothetical protein